MADTLDVLTLAEGHTAVGIGSADTSQDTSLSVTITAVSRRLDQLVGPIVQRTITNEVQPGGCESIRVNLWPVSSWTTVTEYDSTVAQVLTAEDFDTQPAFGFYPGRWHTATATYDGTLHRRSSGSPATFATGPEAVKLTYVAGRYASTTSVDPLFKEAASVMLSNAWRPRESAVQMVGEFDVPAQNFPRFGVPNYVRDLLHDEWIDGPKIG